MDANRKLNLFNNALMIMSAMMAGRLNAQHAIPRHKWRPPQPSDYRFYRPSTNWKRRLGGHTNGKRECARRMRQLGVQHG